MPKPLDVSLDPLEIQKQIDKFILKAKELRYDFVMDKIGPFPEYSRYLAEVDKDNG